MNVEKIKEKCVGAGLRRARYERRYLSLRDKNMYEIGKKMGISDMESVMLYEIFDYKMYMSIRRIFEINQN